MGRETGEAIGGGSGGITSCGNLSAIAASKLGSGSLGDGEDETEPRLADVMEPRGGDDGGERRSGEETSPAATSVGVPGRDPLGRTTNNIIKCTL
ncbi:unnamed protein product [Arabis nemorensis]|uniref:Uncharacterized protein n=1 Tax=Arabis nemorensis TaxID=586526 RepID=A0A565BK03_9BRAS|nr:unnamed protein product [Arabis nemorensis]